MLEQLKDCSHVDGHFWVHTVLKAHIKNGASPRVSFEEAEHIIDYFESSSAPKRLKKMSVKDALRLSKEWTERLIKKAGDVVETEGDVEVVKKLKSGRKLVKLVGKAAFEREGSLMRHCVGSYADKSDVSIYSLRDADNMPHATIEVADSVSQIKGKGNGCIHPKYIQDVIQVLQYFELDVRDSELNNLGYTKLADEVWEEIDTNWTNVKEMTFNNKRYFYLPCGPYLREV